MKYCKDITTINSNKLCRNKMKNKKYDTLPTVPNSFRNIIKKDKFATPSTHIRDMCLFCRLYKQYVNFNIYITKYECWNNILMYINTNGTRIHFLTKTISSCIRTFEFFPLFHNNNWNIVESGVKHHNHNHDNNRNVLLS
jgi:hypothetical protein